MRRTQKNIPTRTRRKGALVERSQTPLDLHSESYQRLSLGNKREGGGRIEKKTKQKTKQQ